MIGRHVTHYNETVLLALLVADEPVAAPIGSETCATPPTSALDKEIAR